MTMSWGELEQNKVVTEVDDDATRSLFALIPEERREMAEPMLRGLLSMIKAQIGPEAYATFCADMRLAYEYYEHGDENIARALLAHYGLDWDTLMGMVR
jgi:hypothetical protein